MSADKGMDALGDTEHIDASLWATGGYELISESQHPLDHLSEQQESEHNHLDMEDLQ